jgi:hypothetical protein
MYRGSEWLGVFDEENQKPENNDINKVVVAKIGTNPRPGTTPPPPPGSGRVRVRTIRIDRGGRTTVGRYGRGTGWVRYQKLGRIRKRPSSTTVKRK